MTVRDAYVKVRFSVLAASVNSEVPGQMQQAEDRAHRIGQRDCVSARGPAVSRPVTPEHRGEGGIEA